MPKIIVLLKVEPEFWHEICRLVYLATGLFGVRPDRVDDIGVAFNGKIKAPPSTYSGLPDASGFIVFLGPEGRVT